MIFSESLKKSSDFAKVYKNKNSTADGLLVLYILPTGSGRNRLGISVSKKVGNSVVRHRITRLIRESYRLNEVAFHSGYDIVVIARAASKGKNFEDICRSLIKLSGRQHILREE